jgi:tetratricopeptide (TPR) repeat protein
VLGTLSQFSGNWERATAFARESLQLNRESGDLSGIADSLTRLARLAIWSGDFSSPAAWLDEALSIVRQIGDQTTEEYVLNLYGVLAYWQGNYRQARAYYEEVIQLSERLEDQFQGAWSRVFMAYALVRQGEIQPARELFEACIQRAYKADWMINLVFAVEGLASLNVNQAHPERAARLFAWADAMREKIGDTRPSVEAASVEKDLAVIPSKVHNMEITNLSAEGRSMTVQQAIHLALDRTDE